MRDGPEPHGFWLSELGWPWCDHQSPWETLLSAWLMLACKGPRTLSLLLPQGLCTCYFLLEHPSLAPHWAHSSPELRHSISEDLPAQMAPVSL